MGDGVREIIGGWIINGFRGCGEDFGFCFELYVLKILSSGET